MEISIRMIFAAIINITFLFLMCWVTIAILRRYRETRYQPALLVGSGFFLLGFIFTPFLAAGRTIMELRPDIAGLVGPGPAGWFNFFRIVHANSFVIGLFLFAVFTRQVFRPRSTASFFFLIFIGILLIGHSDLVLMFEQKAIASGWGARFEIKIIYVIGNTLAFGWMAYESLSRWRLYRSQLKEGKKLDPLVVNRFLLWGLAGISYLGTALTTLAFIPYEAIQPLLPSLILQLCILAFAILSYLSWSPPDWYKRIIRKGEPA